MSVYIVDDSKAIRDRLMRELKERIKVVRIKTAESISDVQADLVNFFPDIMIIDIHLKKSSGFDVLELLQNKEINPLILILTNYSIQPYKEKALMMGADYFFDKSNEFNEAIAVIEKHANQQ